MASHIGRRKFLATLGGTVIAWPLAARAQQTERLHRIALFPLGAESDPQAQAYVRALRQSLEKLGWIEGQNIRIDIRWQSDDVGRMQADLAGALSLAPEIIVSGGTPVTEDLRQRTRTIPIVFVNVADPLTSGLVHSLAQPGGNVTGFSSYESSIGGKWVELLKEIAPRLDRLLVLANPQNPTWKFHVPTIKAATQSFALPLTVAHVRHSRRNRARDRCVCREPGRGHDRATEPLYPSASRTDHRTGSQASLACRLCNAPLRRERRIGVLRFQLG
jgi:putative tryptophan/tyrosine transport system substrate-binding protein